MRTARAKGLDNNALLIRHALRNASVPIVTIIGIGIALLIGGVVVTESVFNIPGLGRLTIDAVLRRDYPIIQGVILIFLGRLCDREPCHRPLLYRSRPEDPLLMADAPQVAAFPGEVEDEGPRPGAWARFREYSRRHPTVIVGGGILILMALAAVACAPDCPRPAPAEPDQPAEAAGRSLLVRRRLSRPRRLCTHHLWRPDLAHGGPCRGCHPARSSGSPSAWLPAISAGSMRL